MTVLERIQDCITANASELDCYDRVTTILSAFTNYDHIDPEVLKRKAEIGTSVHSSIEAYNKNLGMIIENDEVMPYLDSFLKWKKINNKIIISEERLICPELKITGQIDMIMEVEGKNVIFDVKTSTTMHRHYELQLSAYAYLARKHGIEIEKQAILLLNKEGKEPQEIYCEDRFPLFLSCIDVYRFFALWK